MIHHFKPTVTSIMAVPLGPDTVRDTVGLLEIVPRPVDAHAPTFEVQADGSVVVRALENQAMRYGAISDPATWWLLVNSAAEVWFTTENPYDNPNLVPAQQAR